MNDTHVIETIIPPTRHSRNIGRCLTNKSEIYTLLVQTSQTRHKLTSYNINEIQRTSFASLTGLSFKNAMSLFGVVSR